MYFLMELDILLLITLEIKKLLFKHVHFDGMRYFIGPFEWLFSSSTFFTFCYILLDWLFDFFRRRQNEKEKFTVKFLLNDL